MRDQSLAQGRTQPRETDKPEWARAYEAGYRVGYDHGRIDAAKAAGDVPPKRRASDPELVVALNREAGNA